MYTLASEESYRDGEIIFEEGTSGDWLYVILSGSVEISKDVHGRKMFITVLKEGEVFGELAFISKIPRTATAKAVGKTTVGVIDRDFFEKEYNQLSGQMRTILDSVVHRFETMLEKLSGFGARTHPRQPKVLSLVYKDRQTFIHAYTANVSNGGLFVKTNKPLEKNFGFMLKLQLPGLQEPLLIKSQVAWTRTGSGAGPSKPPGMGITFLELSSRDRRILHDYLGPETDTDR